MRHKFFQKKKKRVEDEKELFAHSIFLLESRRFVIGMHSHFASRYIFFAILQLFLALPKRKSISVRWIALQSLVQKSRMERTIIRERISKPRLGSGSKCIVKLG